MRHNVAAGSDHYGFWYRAETHVTGASAGSAAAAKTCPKGVPLLEFYNNTAHSNGRYGLRIYDEYFPKQHPCSSHDPVTNPYVDARFLKFLTYRNVLNGVQISRVAHLILERFQIADNLQSGIEWPGAQGGILVGGWGKNILRDTFIIGLSDPIHVNLTELMDARAAESAAGARRLIRGRAAPPMNRGRRLGGKGSLASGMETPGEMLSSFFIFFKFSFFFLIFNFFFYKTFFFIKLFFFADLLLSSSFFFSLPSSYCRQRDICRV